MKITFTEDHISRYSGNSFYKAGTQADLRHGQRLIDLGVARDGWEDTAAIDEDESLSQWKDWPVEDLRKAAKNAGIPGYARMKKSTLIEKLSK